MFQHCELCNTSRCWLPLGSFQYNLGHRVLVCRGFRTTKHGEFKGHEVILSSVFKLSRSRGSTVLWLRVLRAQRLGMMENGSRGDEMKRKHRLQCSHIRVVLLERMLTPTMVLDPFTAIVVTWQRPATRFPHINTTTTTTVARWSVFVGRRVWHRPDLHFCPYRNCQLHFASDQAPSISNRLKPFIIKIKQALNLNPKVGRKNP